MLKSLKMLHVIIVSSIIPHVLLREGKLSKAINTFETLLATERYSSLNCMMDPLNPKVLNILSYVHSKIFHTFALSVRILYCFYRCK